MKNNNEYNFVYYLVRDVFRYAELKKLKEFIDEILEDKKQGGYVD
jgi:hypothetical protein